MSRNVRSAACKCHTLKVRHKRTLINSLMAVASQIQQIGYAYTAKTHYSDFVHEQAPSHTRVEAVCF